MRDEWTQKRGIKLFQGVLIKEASGGQPWWNSSFLFFSFKPFLSDVPCIPKSRLEKGSPARGKRRLSGKQRLVQGSPGTHTNSSAPCLGRDLKHIQS